MKHDESRSFMMQGLESSECEWYDEEPEEGGYLGHE